MSKICNKCGAKIEDSKKTFCPNCGNDIRDIPEEVKKVVVKKVVRKVEDVKIETPKEEEHVHVEKKKKTKEKKNSNKKLFIVLGCIVGFIVIIFVSLMMYVGSPRRVLKNYWTGMENKDVNKVVNTMYDGYIEGYKNYAGEDFSSLLEGQFKAYDYTITEYEVNYNYIELNSSETKSCTNMLKKYYKIDSDKIKDIRKYAVNYTVKYSNGTIDYAMNYSYLLKIGFKWYVFPIGDE